MINSFYLQRCQWLVRSVRESYLLVKLCLQYIVMPITFEFYNKS